MLLDASGGWNPLHSLNAAAIAKAGRQRPTNNALLCVPTPSPCRLVLPCLLSEATSETARHGKRAGLVCTMAATNPEKVVSPNATRSASRRLRCIAAFPRRVAHSMSHRLPEALPHLSASPGHSVSVPPPGRPRAALLQATVILQRYKRAEELAARAGTRHTSAGATTPTS